MQFEERQHDAARKNKGRQWISQRWTLKRFDVLGVMHEHIVYVRVRRNKAKYWKCVQYCLQMFRVLLKFTDIYLKIIMQNS
jgi:hypothetical protein